MGQMLSEPVRDKHSSSSANDRFAYGASAMQGWRISMEDAHTTILDVDGKKNTSFFAVYDGHGGSAAAKYAGRSAHLHILNNEEFDKKNYAAALKAGFLTTDVELRKDPGHAREPSGCTAVAVLVTEDNHVYCANAGDSRSILSSKGVAIPLSYDHKPTNQTEYERINKAGGFVQFGRVNGNLALSRAFGDFEFKQNQLLRPEEQVVTANPDIIDRKLEPDDEFIVLACDGIWDCMSNQQVANFVRQRIASSMPLAQICEELMENCLAPSSHAVGVGCDNMTVVIVGILNGQGDQHMITKCQTPSAAPAEEDSKEIPVVGSMRGAPPGLNTGSASTGVVERPMYQVYSAQFESELENQRNSKAEQAEEKDEEGGEDDETANVSDDDQLDAKESSK